MTSEHNTGRRVILRVGSGHNKWYVTLAHYHGPLAICPELLAALAAELGRRYGGGSRQAFDHVEILGTESGCP